MPICPTSPFRRLPHTAGASAAAPARGPFVVEGSTHRPEDGQRRSLRCEGSPGVCRQRLSHFAVGCDVASDSRGEGEQMRGAAGEGKRKTREKQRCSPRDSGRLGGPRGCERAEPVVRQRFLVADEREETWPRPANFFRGTWLILPESRHEQSAQGLLRQSGAVYCNSCAALRTGWAWARMFYWW